MRPITLKSWSVSKRHVLHAYYLTLIYHIPGGSIKQDFIAISVTLGKIEATQQPASKP